RVKMVLIPATILGLGLCIALFAPRSYRSEAKLALQVGRESVKLDQTAQTGQQNISMQMMGRDAEVVTALELLRSRGVVSKVVDRLGSDYILRGGPAGEEQPSNVVSDAYSATIGAAMSNTIKLIKSIDPISDREEAIIEVEQNFLGDAERDSTLINVSYSTSSAKGAKEILETIIDIYKEEHLRIHRNEGSRSFFLEQEDLIRDQLDAAMDEVRKAKNEIGVASIGSRRENLEAQLQSITMAAYQAETERKALVSEMNDLHQQLGEMPERLISSKKSVPNQGADLLRDQLYALQVRQAELKARYSTSHPLVLAISQQVEEAEKFVDDESTTREETIDDINPVHRALTLAAKQKQSKIASLDARLRALRDQDATIRDDLEQLNADAMHLAQLEREEQILSRKFHRYTENLEQTRIDEELENQEISSISIAQDPTLAEKPASPSKVLVGLGSMVLAFAGTIATVLGLEQLSDKLRTEHAVEQATEVPVLASIPDSAVHGRVLAP
ncbi:MAG: hypothetical protein AAF266_05380, partial [Planctomycetota bacterium]